MSGPLLYDFGGLVTEPGLLARNPASCVAVQNYRFPAAGVMRKRTGWSRSAAAAGANEEFISLMTRPGATDAFYAVSNLNTLWRGGTGGWTSITDVTAAAPPTHSIGTGRARTFSMGGIDYVASQGVRRIESANYRVAGMPRGRAPFTYSMNAAVFTVLAGAGGYLVDGANAAYRITYHRKVGTSELGGAPSSRLVVRNIAGTSGYLAATTQQVAMRVPVPYELDSSTVLIDTECFWRLWRSASITGDTANDEMYLVGERFFTSAEITAGYAVFTDLTPDAFLYGQPKLHTNSLNYPQLDPSLANGQTYADEAPPVSQDACAWANSVWYALSRQRAALNVKLISASFAAGNTVVINGQTCTAVAGAPVNPGDFTIVTTLATLALNIEATARNLADAYNRTSARATVQAFTTSQGPDAGSLFLEGNTNVASFGIQSAAAGALFRPNITNQLLSTANAQANALFFSKPGRADAVPPINMLEVGPTAATIYRLVPFRERLLVFTSGGLYQVDGTDYSNFTVSLVDETIVIYQQEAIAVVRDAVYAWCVQGVIEITDGGSSVVSDKIKPDIDLYRVAPNSPPSSFHSSFAVGSQLQGRVMIWRPLNIFTQQQSGWFEFDVATRKWTTGATTDGTTRISGCEQSPSGLIALAGRNTSVGVGPARWFLESSGYADDSYAAGTAQPIVSTATFQFQLPDPDARQHWQQLLLQFENGELYGNRPTGVALSWSTDIVSGAGGATYALSSPILRVETPTAARRATRQQVTLTHSLAEPCGLLALNQTVRGAVSRFPK